jgi:diguanylate cyclase (GGDEF)-like protein
MPDKPKTSPDPDAALARLAERIGEGAFLKDLLQGVYDGFRDLIPYTRIGCALIDRDRKTVVARWARSDAERLEIYAGYSQPLAGSSLERILQTGEPRIINDLEAYLAAHPDSDATRRIVAEGIRSSFTCPLVAHGLPVGFLFFSSDRKDTYRDAHHDVFRRIARQLSLVVEKSLLYEELFAVNQKLQQAEQKLAYQSLHDDLTGLPNRRSLRERLETEVARAARHRTTVGLVMLDLDRFHEVNDAFGHAVGDALIGAVAEALRGSVRSFECLGRWGGEEFMLILHDTSEQGVTAAAERLRRAVETLEYSSGGRHVKVTASTGATAAIPDHPAWSDILAHAADTALHAAKSAGRNRTAFRTT